MFTYSLALLKALGIDYESLSELMVLRGKRYQRGPSFTKQEYLQAADYCLMSSIQGATCILVDSIHEFTVWLHLQNSESVESAAIDQSEAVDKRQSSYQQTSESKFQLTYRGVKYGVNHELSKPDINKPSAQINHDQINQSSAQLNPDPWSQLIYRGAMISS